MPKKGFSHRMLHGGGSDLRYGLRYVQAEHFMQLKIGETNALSNFTKNNNY